MLNVKQTQDLLNKPDSLKTIWLRFKAPSPRLFKNILMFCASLLGLGTGILGIPAIFTGMGIEFSLPDWLNEAAKYIIMISVIAGLISKLSVNWKKVENGEATKEDSPSTDQ